jgi:hypothetical protein
MTMIVKMVIMAINIVKILSVSVLTTVLMANRVINHLNFLPPKHNSVKNAVNLAKYYNNIGNNFDLHY